MTKKECLWYTISRTQRESEKARELSLDGTIHYEHRGCYQCRGENPSCSTYCTE